MIAENSNDLYMTKVDFEWIDIGSYDVLEAICKHQNLEVNDLDVQNITKFNEANDKFELIYLSNVVEIVRK